MKLQYIDLSKEQLERETGLTTFRNTFVTVLMPFFSRTFDFVEEDADIILSMHYANSLKIPAQSRCITIEHHIRTPENRSEHHSFIAHSMFIKEKYEKLGIRTHFVPLSIDTENLPFNPTERNGKLIYFGNLGSERKKRTLEALQQFMEIDVLTDGKLNGEPAEGGRSGYLHIVSQYSYGMGVGQSLLEMLGMSLKCFVVGDGYGGIIINDAQFREHQQHSFSSQVYSSNETAGHVPFSPVDDIPINQTLVNKDMEQLTTSSYVVPQFMFDIRTYAKLYKGNILNELFKIIR